MASVLTAGFFLPVSLKNSAGRLSQPAESMSWRELRLPAGERVTAVAGHARVAIAISAVATIIGVAAAVIDRATAVIGGTAAVIGGTAAIVVVVAVVLRRSDPN